MELVESRAARLAELCQRHRVRRLELFGSATGASFTPTSSDLDFLVDFEALCPSDHSRAYFGLLFDLEDLFGRKVDLVEAPTVTNPWFLGSIRPTRRVLYAA